MSTFSFRNESLEVSPEFLVCERGMKEEKRFSVGVLNALELSTY
jgi:hypothetical protein